MSHLRRSLHRNIIMSLSLTFSISYALSVVFPFTMAALALGIIVVTTHEIGHYYSALLHGGQPDIPIVIPLGIGAIGMTRVRRLPQLSPRTKRYIIAAGPVAGVLVAASLLPYAILFGNTIVVLTAFGLIAMEAYGGYFGSDGKKWRRERGQHGMA